MAAPLLTAGIGIPAGAHAALRLDFDLHALRAVMVQREGVSLLSADAWERPGVYVLIGSVAYGTPTEVRVGQSVKLRSRLTSHVRKPPIPWWRALAVVRDTTIGFHSAQIRYIEGALADELSARPGVKLFEGQRDADTTLPAYERASLDAFVQTIIEGLKVAGVSLASPANAGSAEEEVAKPDSSHARIPGTVSDLLAAGLLADGDLLEAKQLNRETGELRVAKAEVLASGDLRVDGVSYRSPSTAVTKGLDIPAGNGWKAWKLEGRSTSLADLRDKLDADSSDDGSGASSEG